MKKLLFLLVLLFHGTAVFALNPDDLKSNHQVRLTAMDLVRQQKSQDAVNYISANVRSDETGPRRDLTVAQELIGMAFGFQNRREHAEAFTAAHTALEKINTLPLRAGRDPQMGRVLANAALMCEQVLRDPVTAKKLYQAALRAHPENKPAQERLELMRHKRIAVQTGAGNLTSTQTPNSP